MIGNVFMFGAIREGAGGVLGAPRGSMGVGGAPLSAGTSSAFGEPCLVGSPGCTQ